MTATSSKLRHELVADRIEQQIAAGFLAAHDRVPSLRAMSDAAGVSVGTVVEGYAHLESRGVLYTRPRSGYFVSPRRASLPAPAGKRAFSTRPVNVTTKVLDTVIESLGRTDLVALNSAITKSAERIDGRLNAIARAILRSQPHNANALLPVAGLEPLRREIAKRMALWGVAADPNDVVITSGTTEALALALSAVCSAGDTVLIESPTYTGILQMLERLRLKVVEVPNRPGHGIELDAVEQVVRRTKVAAAVVQTSFNNPTGALMSDDAKRQLVAMLTHAGIRIIEDDIYGDLHFGPQRPPPLAAFDDSGLVITCASISKTVAIGYRIGWAISPRYAADITRAKFSTSITCPTLQQHIVAQYFTAGLHERHLRKIRAGLSINCRRFREAVERAFPAGTRVSNPEGGVVLWIELPKGLSGVEIFERALAKQIGITPGTIYSAKGDYGNFIRLSAGVEWTPAVAKALDTLGRLATASR
jgi:DNA-binding transcriptional MocR family regulator